MLAFSGTNGAGQTVSDSNPLPTTSSLSIPKYDYVSCSYTGANLTGVVFKTGGAGGVTVATLALAYDGSNNLLTVTKS